MKLNSLKSLEPMHIRVSNTGDDWSNPIFRMAFDSVCKSCSSEEQCITKVRYYIMTRLLVFISNVTSSGVGSGIGRGLSVHWVIDHAHSTKKKLRSLYLFCVTFFQPGTCSVNMRCFLHGDISPTNSCLRCLSNINSEDWTPRLGNCQTFWCQQCSF